MVKIVTQGGNLVWGQVKAVLHKVVYAIANFIPDPGVGRIEGVIQVEDQQFGFHEF
jgi:hypothetical protein